MNRVLLPCLCLMLGASGLRAYGQAKPCSTEKVNHETCRVTIDRRYPVTLPTIQMAPDTKVIVQVQDPTAFETITLDETSAAALPGTDQGAALLTSALPDLKGLTWSEQVSLPQVANLADNRLDPMVAVVTQDLAELTKTLTDARSPIDTVLDHGMIVYAQLNQIFSPLPRPQHSGASAPPPLVAAGTPSPWDEYSDWRTWMLCELIGGPDCKVDTSDDPSDPAFNNVLSEISHLQQRLPAAPPAAAPPNVLFDQHGFDVLAQHALGDIGRLAPKNRPGFTMQYNQLIQRENQLVAIITSLATTLPSMQKDFQTYFQNIQLATGMLPLVKGQIQSLPNPYDVGIIFDPKSSQPAGSPVTYRRLLGRQVVYSVNLVNQVATSRASVTAASAKSSIATITVLYADPRFEASTGAIFSFVHNRTFSNQTVTTVPAGSSLAAGDVQINEDKKRPEVIPFVAANWRIGNDWLMPDHRRGAFYGTAWLGLNPYNTLPEFGGGPTISWRSFMVSAFYHRAHDTRLTPGLTVGQIVCSPAAMTGATPPPCSPAPASPTTQTYTTNAFAIGLSVRVATVFAAATGGVSR